MNIYINSQKHYEDYLNQLIMIKRSIKIPIKTTNIQTKLKNLNLPKLEHYQLS